MTDDTAITSENSFLLDEEVEKRLHKVKFDVATDINNTNNSYAKGRERSFNPLTDEEKTKQYVDHQHIYAHGAVDEEHFIENERMRAKRAVKKSPEAKSHVVRIINWLRSLFEDTIQNFLIKKNVEKDMMEKGYIAPQMERNRKEREEQAALKHMKDLINEHEKYMAQHHAQEIAHERGLGHHHEHGRGR